MQREIRVGLKISFRLLRCVLLHGREWKSYGGGAMIIAPPASIRTRVQPGGRGEKNPRSELFWMREGNLASIRIHEGRTFKNICATTITLNLLFLSTRIKSLIHSLLGSES